MRERLTISIPAAMRKQLSQAAKAEGVTQSEFVSQALKTALFRKSFRAARAELLPKVSAQNIYTDEDIFEMLS